MALVGATGSFGSPDMVEVGTLALGGDASESAVAPGWLHAVLLSLSATAAELVTLRLPELQPVHALRLDVPSAPRVGPGSSLTITAPDDTPANRVRDRNLVDTTGASTTRRPL
jgi:hypothetical protein